MIDKPSFHYKLSKNSAVGHGRRLQRLRTQMLGERHYVRHCITTVSTRQNHGGIIASGVYFYKIEAGAFIRTREMIFMK